MKEKHVLINFVTGAEPGDIASLRKSAGFTMQKVDEDGDDGGHSPQTLQISTTFTLE